MTAHHPPDGPQNATEATTAPDPGGDLGAVPGGAQRSTEGRETIKPEDVPDELAILFCDAWWTNNPTWSRQITEHRQQAARSILAAVLPAHEAMVLDAHRPLIVRVARAQVGAEMDALRSTPAAITYGGGCVECDEAFEPGEAVTWRWRYAPAGLIHDECRRDGDKQPLTEAEIRADERAKVAEEIEAQIPFAHFDVVIGTLNEAARIARGEA